jgi:hypothetical protein
MFAKRFSKSFLGSGELCDNLNLPLVKTFADFREKNQRANSDEFAGNNCNW